MIFANHLKNAIDKEAQRVRDSTLREIKDRYGYKKHVNQSYIDGVIAGLNMVSKSIDNVVINFGEWHFFEDEKPPRIDTYLVTIVDVKTGQIREMLSKWNGYTWVISAIDDDLTVVCWHEIPNAYSGDRIEHAKKLKKSGVSGFGVKIKDYKVYKR